MKSLLIIAFIIGFGMYACSKKASQPLIVQANMPADVVIHYVDQNGNNLFTSSGANGYVMSNIRTYTYVNGSLSLDSLIVINPGNNTSFVAYNPSWQNVYDSTTKDSVYCSIFSLSINKINYFQNPYDTVLIRLKRSVTDTLRTYIDHLGMIDSIWINGQFISNYPLAPKNNSYYSGHIFTIVKND